MSQTAYNLSQPSSFPGLMAEEPNRGDVLSKCNTGDPSVPFGTAVILDTGDDNGAKIPAAASTVWGGIVRHSNAYARVFSTPDGQTVGDLDSVGLVTGAMMNVVRRGKMWVPVEDVVVPGDRLRIRIAQHMGAGQIGGFRKGSVGGETQDMTANIVVLTGNGAVGKNAMIDFDFGPKAGAAD